jgi:hypothetical protein
MAEVTGPDSSPVAVELPHDGDAVDEHGLAWKVPSAALRPGSMPDFDHRGTRMNECDVGLIYDVGRLRERRLQDRAAEPSDRAVGVLNG